MPDQSWKRPVEEQLERSGLVRTRAGYYSPPGDTALDASAVCADIDYVSRLNAFETTTAGEWPYYRQALDRWIGTLPPAPVIVDLGCGDGRVTMHLLESTDARIVATDIGVPNISRLWTRLPEKWRERCVGVVADARDTPLPAQLADGVCAMGLLHLLKPDAARILQHIHTWLRPEGILIDSEALLSGSLLYAIVRRDPEEFLKVAAERTKTSAFDQAGAARIPVLTPREIQQMLADAGFEGVGRVPVPVFPSLVYGGWFKSVEVSAPDRARIHEVLRAFSSEDEMPERVQITISKKVA